jgi:Amidohydrolase family
MTTLPASVFGLKDRGVLRTGAWADILIFDPTKVRDAATYLEPHQMSEGIDYTIVNGILVRDAGTFTGKLPGRVVRLIDDEPDAFFPLAAEAHPRRELSLMPRGGPRDMAAGAGEPLTAASVLWHRIRGCVSWVS